MPIKRYDKNTVLDVVHVDHLRLELDEPEPLLPQSLPPEPDPVAEVAPAAEPSTPDATPLPALPPAQPKSGKD